MKKKSTYKVAVFSSAGSEVSPENRLLAESVGKYLADQGIVVVTGGSLGIPGLVISAAFQNGGYTEMFSPDPDEVSHGARHDNAPSYLFRGKRFVSGFTERSLQMIREVDGAIILNGRMGTLSEFTMAVEEGLDVAVLENTGGTSAEFKRLLELSQKDTQGKVIFSDNYKDAVDQLIEHLKSKQPKSSIELSLLRFNWSFDAYYAGFLTAQATGLYEQEGITITHRPNPKLLNPVESVLSGDDDFGIVPDVQQLFRHSRARDLKIIAHLFHQDPFGYLFRSELEIETPKDFEGKKVGVFSNGNNMAAYETLLKKYGVHRANIEEIELDVDGHEQFYAGDIDIVPAFREDQYEEARQRGLDVHFVQPREWGVQTTGYVLFTRNDVLENRLDLVVNYLKATVKGYQLALDDTADALKTVLAYNPDLREARQKTIMNVLPEYLGRDGKIGTIDRSLLKNILRPEQEGGFVPSSLQLEDLIDDSPLEQALNLLYLDEGGMEEVWDFVSDAYKYAPKHDMLDSTYITDPALFTVLDDVKDKRIIDIGCGDGFYCRYLAERGAKVTGVDISGKMIAIAKSFEEKDSLEAVK